MVVELMSSSISWRVDPHAAALGRLQELYGISVVSHIRFTKIELANNSLDRRMAQRILGQERPLPVGVVMRAWATMYELEYAYEDDVHVFRNPKQHWEPEYSHSDGLLRRIEAVPMTEAVPLTTLADLLAPTQNARRAEGLSVWREWAEPLMHSRAKIQFFGALDEAQREQAAKREGLPLVLLSGDLQVQFWQAFGLAAAIPPPAVQRRVVLRTLRPPVQASVRAEWLWFEIRE